MKGGISAGGALFIERAGIQTTQSCPFKDGSFCGDWCPLFGEPEYQYEYPEAHIMGNTPDNKRIDMGGRSYAWDKGRHGISIEEFIKRIGEPYKRLLDIPTPIHLCHATLKFDEFTDERAK